MIPNDRMILGEEGIFYRDHLKDLARQGVPSSEMPSFKDWQNGELKRMTMSEERIFAKEAAEELARERKQAEEHRQILEQERKKREEEKKKREQIADNLFIEKLQVSGLNSEKVRETLEWLVKYLPQFKTRIRDFLCSDDEEIKDYFRIIFDQFFDHDKRIQDSQFVQNQKLLEACSNLERTISHTGSEIAINRFRFIDLYSRIKKRFPDQMRIHQGFLSTADDINLFLGEGNVGTVRLPIVVNSHQVRDHQITTDNFSIDKYFVTLEYLVNHEVTSSNKPILLQKPYNPSSHARKSLGNIVNTIFNNQHSAIMIAYNDQRNPWQNLNELFSKQTDFHRKIKQFFIEQELGPQTLHLYNDDDLIEKISLLLEMLRRADNISDGQVRNYWSFHDLLLPIYYQLKGLNVTQIYVGQSQSVFIDLNPNLPTQRCTAGNGDYRLVSYQYALDEDIHVIDLSVNSIDNKLAELVIVDCKDEQGNFVSVVETAEASPEALMLPDFQGLPGWCILLLDNIIDYTRSRNLGREYSSIIISTNVDKKPASNQFVQAAAILLNGITIKPQVPQKYKPSYKREPLEWDEPLTTYSWKNAIRLHSEHLRFTHHVEKQGPKIRRFTRMPPGNPPMVEYESSINKAHGFKDNTYLGAWDTEDNLQVEWRYRVLSFLTERFAFWISQEAKDEKLKQWRHKQELKSPFECDRYHKFNNGRGRVNGVRWNITDDNYILFKNLVSDYKQHLGLKN